MDAYWMWSLICVAVAILLFVLEIFVPTGGIASVLCAVAVIAAVVLAFMSDTTFGAISLIAALIAAIIAPFIAMRIMPDTPFVRWLTLTSDKRDAATDEGNASSGAANVSRLVGAKGKSLTDLRPVGTCLINGERHDCLAERGIILAGRQVEVVSAEGMQIKVREIT